MVASASRRSSGSGSAAVGICRPALIWMVPIAAGGSYEFVDAPAGLSLDEVADGHRGEHDRHVGFDRFALVVGEGRVFRDSLWWGPCGDHTLCAMVNDLRVCAHLARPHDARHVR